MKVIKELVERSPEIGLMEIEQIVRKQNGFLIRLYKTNRYWHVVYRVAA